MRLREREREGGVRESRLRSMKKVEAKGKEKREKKLNDIKDKK